MDTDTTAEQPPQSRRWPARLVKLAVVLLLAPIIAVVWAWSIGAVYYMPLPSVHLRAILAVGFGLGVLISLIAMRRHFLRWLIGFLTVYVLLLVGWAFARPSNDRLWQPSVARPARIEIDGDRLTIHDFRNFDYTEAGDPIPRYEDRTFDLNLVDSLDLILSYFGGMKAMAHTFLSFGFSDGQHLAISIEVRKEQGEGYDPVRGLYKQYEVFYVIGDERDVIRLRTNFRGEQVYLYPTNTAAEEARALLEEMLRYADDLNDQPVFYHTIYRNCTTSIIRHVRQVVPGRPLDIRMILNGYVDELGYERAWFDNTVPFRELKECCHINARAIEAGDVPEFSALIRQSQ